ncbi:unnamed protein product [Cuscuta epithymum]|uniref:Uncharacterized protein n=1 Tax=Cuscuta epithymum TaxID=186058 RepID=A0AAV0GJ07_9ASTE|nr:unnamed protein product [Cuscuta epithymum]
MIMTLALITSCNLQFFFISCATQFVAIEEARPSIAHLFPYKPVFISWQRFSFAAQYPFLARTLMSEDVYSLWGAGVVAFSVQEALAYKLSKYPTYLVNIKHFEY